MKIILLAGNANMGKTSTMIQLYNELKKNDNMMKILEGEEPRFSEENTKKLKDFECLVSYKGKNIALHSTGDLYYNAMETIIKFADVADVLILAYRTAFAKHPLDQAIKKSLGSNRVFYKDSQKPFDEGDCKKAQEIMECLNSIVLGGVKNA